MSEVLNQAVEALNAKLGDADFSGTAKFVIKGEGAVMVDSNGARAADEPADVTLTADADTFQGIMSGDTNPTSAFMTGKLQVSGDMGLAMKLASQMS